MNVDSFALNVDGRRLVGVRAGARGAPAFVFHNGTPTAAMLLPDMVEAAGRHGLQAISFSRPGYSGSTRNEGRTVADNVALTAAVLHDAGAPWFVALGWSGGGPHALADAALAANCRGAATIASVAPHVPALDWLAGMAPSNVEEYGAAIDDRAQLWSDLTAAAAEYAEVDGASIAAQLGDLVPPVDVAAITGEFADALAGCMRESVSNGPSGWFDDDVAFVEDWGFDVAKIAVPVALWHGGLDLMVPFSHGQWLARAIPDARANLFDEEGHLSLGVSRISAIIDDLVASA